MGVMDVEPMCSDTVFNKSSVVPGHLTSKPSSPAARLCASPTRITDILLTPVQSKHIKPTVQRFKRKESDATSSTDTGSDSDDVVDRKLQDRLQRNRNSAAQSGQRKPMRLDE